MRFWFEHSSDVPLREQVVAQVTLGILSGELAAGDRLPSIRDLARRFGLHANTVSAGYRQLEAEGWVVSRRGSGVYVQPNGPVAPSQTASSFQVGSNHLDRLIANLFETARRLNIPASDVVARVTAWSGPTGFNRILLIEPDPELRRIVLAELAEAVTLPIEGRDFGPANSSGALVCTLPSKLARVQSDFAAIRVHCLRIRSVPVSLAEHLPSVGARASLLVGIDSRWPEFLRFARTMLVAAGFSPDALIVRDARQPGWQQGLTEAAAVVCDLPTAQSLPNARVIVSRILAEGVSEELLQLT